jgi:beta-phosphoglucomutase-like phosphatase (HAD superfamily)
MFLAGVLRLIHHLHANGIPMAVATGYTLRPKISAPLDFCILRKFCDNVKTNMIYLKYI